MIFWIDVSCYFKSVVQRQCTCYITSDLLVACRTPSQWWRPRWRRSRKWWTVCVCWRPIRLTCPPPANKSSTTTSVRSASGSARSDSRRVFSFCSRSTHFSGRSRNKMYLSESLRAVDRGCKNLGFRFLQKKLKTSKSNFFRFFRFVEKP